MKEDFLLGKRKATILKILVKDYIDTYEPVGSNKIASNYGIEVKSATIRNEMAELSDMGLLMQPHKSAGRIPSEQGYRVYVDFLMERCNISNTATKLIYDTLHHKSEMELIINVACKVLSEISGYLAVASHPKINNSVINHISLSKYGPNKLLLVTAISNGYIIHQILFMDINKELYSLKNAQDYLEANFVGKELDTIVNQKPEECVYQRLITEFTEILKTEAYQQNNIKYYFEGLGRLMKLPDFEDLTKLEQIIYTTENPNILNNLFTNQLKQDKMSVLIGNEINIAALKNCSLISIPYKIKDKSSGIIATIGPTRMDYSKSIPAIEMISKHLGLTLTNLSA